MLCSGDKTTGEVRETWLLTKKINFVISFLSSDEIYALLDSIEIDEEEGRELNPIQDGHFQGCSRMRDGAKRPPFPEICHTYPTMMKLGSYTLPKEDPKNISIT